MYHLCFSETYVPSSVAPLYGQRFCSYKVKVVSLHCVPVPQHGMTKDDIIYAMDVTLCISHVVKFRCARDFRKASRRVWPVSLR